MKHLGTLLTFINLTPSHCSVSLRSFTLERISAPVTLHVNAHHQLSHIFSLLTFLAFSLRTFGNNVQNGLSSSGLVVKTDDKSISCRFWLYPKKQWSQDRSIKKLAIFCCFLCTFPKAGALWVHPRHDNKCHSTWPCTAYILCLFSS